KTRARTTRTLPAGGEPRVGPGALGGGWAATPLRAGRVQLDVAAGQRARGAVAVREADAERVAPAGLALVGHVHLVGEPAGTVHLGCALDVTRGRVDDGVRRHARPLHLRPVGAVV